MGAIFHDTQMEYVKGQLQAALEEAHVAHIFLKGTVLKHNYPVPALRTMSDMDILVYAKESDISDSATPYNGEKYDVLKEAGFRYFVGVDATAEGWSELTKEYVRQGRLNITGRNLEDSPELYAGIFDAAAVLDSARK